MRTTITTEPQAAASDERWRLFFALWPTPELAAALHALAGQCCAQTGGRVMRQDTLHLTLAFLGEVPPALLPPLQAMAGEAAQQWAATSVLAVDTLGHWPAKKLTFAGLQQVPAALPALAAALSEGARDLGISLENRRFLPHVTLCRSAKKAPDAVKFTPLCWPVQEFRLVRSRLSSLGADYETLACWPLGPAAISESAG